MPQDTRIALFLMGELVAALRANDPDAFKCWLSGGVQGLGGSGGGAAAAGLALGGELPTDPLSRQNQRLTFLRIWLGGLCSQVFSLSLTQQYSCACFCKRFE